MILAAGLGTRLKELTQHKPKALVEIQGKPLLQHTIENLILYGFDTIIINIHHFGEQIIQYIESHPFDADIFLSDERGQLMDTGGGIIQALPFFLDTQAVMIHNVDILSDVDLRQCYNGFLESSDDAWLLTQNRNTARKLLFDNHDLLVGWKNNNDGQFKWVNHEQQDYRESAFSGIHIFTPSLFADYPLQRYSIIDLYLQLAKTRRIRSLEINPNYWFDLGKIDDLHHIESLLP